MRARYRLRINRTTLQAPVGPTKKPPERQTAIDGLYDRVADRGYEIEMSDSSIRGAEMRDRFTDACKLVIRRALRHPYEDISAFASEVEALLARPVESWGEKPAKRVMVKAEQCPNCHGSVEPNLACAYCGLTSGDRRFAMAKGSKLADPCAGGHIVSIASLHHCTTCGVNLDADFRREQARTAFAELGRIVEEHHGDLRFQRYEPPAIGNGYHHIGVDTCISAAPFGWVPPLNKPEGDVELRWRIFEYSGDAVAGSGIALDELAASYGLKRRQ